MDTDRVLAKLPSLLKAKRREEDLSLREAAKESGVSASTLSRLERGATTYLPDTETLTKLASWLNIRVESLLSYEDQIKGNEDIELTTPEMIEVYLRADKNLSSETAGALSEMFKMLYKQLAERGEDLEEG